MAHSSYGWWHGFWRSWFSKAFYRDVGLHWRGTGFAYLFFLLFVCSVVLSIFSNIYLRSEITNIQANYIPQLPVVSFADGKMTLADGKVHVIENTSGNPWIVFDPTGKYNNDSTSSAAVVLKPDAMYVAESSGAMTVHTYPQSLNVTITSDSANAFAEQAKRWGIVFVGLSLLISAYIYRILASLIYSIIGSIVIAKCLKSTLSYVSVLRIVVVAQTPVIMLSTIGALLNVYVPHAWIGGVIINLFYITWGIKAASSELPGATTAASSQGPSAL